MLIAKLRFILCGKHKASFAVNVYLGCVGWRAEILSSKLDGKRVLLQSY